MTDLRAHAETMSTAIERLERARGGPAIQQALAQLDAELTRHFAAEENELFPELQAAKPRFASMLDHFLDEHADLRTAVRMLHTLVLEERPDMQRQLKSLARQLRDHERREAALLTKAMYDELGVAG